MSPNSAKRNGNGGQERCFIRSRDLPQNLSLRIAATQVLNSSVKSKFFSLFDSFAAATCESSFSCTASYRVSHLAARSSAELGRKAVKVLENQRRDLGVGGGAWFGRGGGSHWGHTQANKPVFLRFPSDARGDMISLAVSRRAEQSLNNL